METTIPLEHILLQSSLENSTLTTHLSVARTESEILDKLKNGKFAVVGISVGSEKAIKNANQLVKAIKKHP